jgi:hypothetical protein
LRRKCAHLHRHAELAGEHQLLVVRGIASQKERGVAVLDDDGNMIGGVTGRGDCDDVSGLRQPPAGSEGTERLRRKGRAVLDRTIPIAAAGRDGRPVYFRSYRGKESRWIALRLLVAAVDRGQTCP